MAGRYLVTGVQLGMLVGLDLGELRNALVNKIIDEQFIKNSQKDISEDVKDLIKGRDR